MYSTDLFAPVRRGGPFSRFVGAVLATAVFRCWALLLFYLGWATAITFISHHVKPLTIQPTLLTVFGTVLGFVVSYRTTASFERYNEGRRLWSQIILGSRTLARTVWFHVPETNKDEPPSEQQKARTLIEKKTVINLIEAFGVAVKHYLRGEEGVYYEDLYHLVKYLPAYALPAGLHIPADSTSLDGEGPPSPPPRCEDGTIPPSDPESLRKREPQTPSVTSDSSRSTLHPPATSPRECSVNPQIPPLHRKETFDKGEMGVASSSNASEDFLLPARNPPKYYLLDQFPFSPLVALLTKGRKEGKSWGAARIRAKLRSRVVTYNLPLEISLYLSSYIAAVQERGVVSAPTATNLLNALNQLVDALTGLERILTTPIPFSYRVQLWSVTLLYNLLLPFQIWSTLGWFTIPATVISSFIFFGFLVAGEEIENPFGYDKNDLNLDHFTSKMIRNELRAITALPAPHIDNWAFSQFNDHIFTPTLKKGVTPTSKKGVTPEQWMERGYESIQQALATI